jgi:recombination DNA repair RAD52 pathway protein
MAIKSAESDALKRAAINLGTQFGLSLYNNGSLRDVVIQTLDQPSKD